MDVFFSKAAVKSLDEMDARTQARIKAAISALPKGDVKQLKGMAGLSRLRVGKWRIVFSCPDEKTIYIERIHSRGDVYKGGLK